MADIKDRKKRSENMSAIRGKDTKPELVVRRFLHAQGFRFRLQRKDLPGKPDLVLPRYNLAIFVHGCFWHRHTGCHYSTTPANRKEFWLTKFADNIRRDRRNEHELQTMGWRVLIIWECGIKHRLDDIEDIPDLVRGTDSLREWPLSPPRINT